MIESIISAETDNKRTAACLLAPDVILLLIQDGTARLLDVGGNFYAISQVGASMLQEALRGDTTTVAHKIATAYEADPQHIQNDLNIFLCDLEEKHLIERPDRTSHLFQFKRTMLPLVFFPLLGFIHASSVSVKTKMWILLTLAYVSFRLFGWPDTVRAWQHYYQKHAKKATTSGSEMAVKAADEAVRAIAANHLLATECKERALCCWAFLRSVGLPAKLVVGINLFPLTSHCWCEFEQTILSDDKDRCERFTPVLNY